MSLHTIAISYFAISGDGSSTTFKLDLLNDPIVYVMPGQGPVEQPKTVPVAIVGVVPGYGTASASLSSNGRFAIVELSPAPPVYDISQNNQLNIGIFLLYP